MDHDQDAVLARERHRLSTLAQRELRACLRTHLDAGRLPVAELDGDAVVTGVRPRPDRTGVRDWIGRLLSGDRRRVRARECWSRRRRSRCGGRRRRRGGRARTGARARADLPNSTDDRVVTVRVDHKEDPHDEHRDRHRGDARDPERTAARRGFDQPRADAIAQAVAWRPGDVVDGVVELAAEIFVAHSEHLLERQIRPQFLCRAIDPRLRGRGRDTKCPGNLFQR